MGVLFKLKSRASSKAKAEVARTLETRFHRHAEPVFPEATEADLANLFALQVPARTAAQVVAVLSGLSAVEYAEVEPLRRLSASSAH